MLSEMGRKKVTIMVIPHSEQSIRNFHLSNFHLFAGFAFLSILCIVSIFLLASITVKSKELLYLERCVPGNEKNAHIFKTEVTAFSHIFNEFQNEMTNYRYPLFRQTTDETAIGGNEIVIDRVPSAMKALLNSGQSTPKDIHKQTLNDSKDFFRYSSGIYKQLNFFVQSRRKFLYAWPNLRPIQNGYNGKVIQDRSGKRLLRIRTFSGMPVIAAGSGTIEKAERKKNGLYSVKIIHDYGISTEYEGILNTHIKPGQKVQKGDKIGAASRVIGYSTKIASEYLNPLQSTHSRF